MSHWNEPSLKQQVRDFTDQKVYIALMKTNGNVFQAAKILKCSRQLVKEHSDLYFIDKETYGD